MQGKWDGWCEKKERKKTWRHFQFGEEEKELTAGTTEPSPFPRGSVLSHIQNLTPSLGSTTSSLGVIMVCSRDSDTSCVIMQGSAECA